MVLRRKPRPCPFAETGKVCRPLLDKFLVVHQPNWRPPGGLDGISNCLRSRRSAALPVGVYRRPSSHVHQTRESRPVRRERGSPTIEKKQVPPVGLVAIFSQKTKEERWQGHADEGGHLSVVFSFQKIPPTGVILRMLPAKRKEGRSGT